MAFRYVVRVTHCNEASISLTPLNFDMYVINY